MSCLLHVVWVLLMSSCAAMEVSQPSAPVQSTVIIIGAGISGIMAAKTLSDNGITDFLILEATDRIGGRMRQADFAGYTIELGANWIEGVGGERKNPIWNLAQQNDLRVFYENVSSVTFNVYSQEGERLPESMVADRFKVALVSHNYTATLGTIFNANGEEDISILTAQRLFGFVPTTPLDMLIDFYNYDAEIAEPPRVTSLKNVQPNPTFQHFGKDEYFVADNRGYAYLVDQLAKGFLEHDTGGFKDSRLKLRKVVRSIDYSYDGVKVELEDNSMYNATYAILSVSLGVLNSNLITFKPDLPYWKIKTFFQFDMSIFTKIFLKFPYTFWPTGPGTEVFLYADRKRGYYPFWKHLEEEYPGSNILFVLVTDNESRRIEQQSDNETKAEIMEVLRTLFGADVPQIEDILVPRWWQNRFFGGSYINWPVGVSVEDFDRMKAPVGPLYFTGEHTSEKFNGYVHGAYLSGIATAQTLLDCINKGHCNETTSDGFPWDQASFFRSERRLQNKEQFDSCIGSCCTEVLKVLQQQKCK